MALLLWNNVAGVNTTTPGDQNLGSVTGLTDGGWVVAWQDHSGTHPSIRYRVFNADGTARSAELAITGPRQELPSVFATADGGFTLTWNSIAWTTFPALEITTGTLLQQHFLATGAADGAATTVATYMQNGGPPPISTPMHSSSVDVGANRYVVWTDINFGAGANYDIRWTRLNADGSVFATAAVNTTRLGVQTSADVAALANGAGFVVSWHDDQADVVRARVYNATGTAQSFEITVGLTGTEAQVYHMQGVAGLSNGNFVVAWTSNGANNDGSGDAIKFQIFTASGATVGVERRVNAVTSGDQLLPDIIALRNGGFAIVHNDQRGSPATVKLGIFDNDGNQVGTESTVAAGFSNGQWAPSLSELADGRIVVTWVPQNGDGSGTAVHHVVLDPRDGIVTGAGTGTAAAQQLYGNSEYNDSITGSSGNDQLFGMAGGDTLRGGTGFNVLDGGPDNAGLRVTGGDIADYTWTTSGVTINLATGTGVNNGGGATQTFNDTLVGIENVAGGVGGDSLTGDSNSNVLGGAGGADTLNGGAGNDYLFGDNAAAANGGIGFGSGLVTSRGTSSIDAVDITNTFSIAANPSINDALTTPHTTTRITTPPSGTVASSWHKLSLTAGSVITLDVDFVSGFHDSWIRLLDPGGNVLAQNDNATGPGEDVGGARSWLSHAITYGGEYFVEVGKNSAGFSPTLPNNITYDLHVSVRGALATLSSAGTGAADTLRGGDGDDTLFGGFGDDVLDGGLNSDTADYSGEAAAVAVYLYDVRNFGGVIGTAAFSSGTSSGVDYLRSVENATGTAGDDYLFGDFQENTLRGGAGNDYLRGLQASDRLHGGAGSDLLLGDDDHDFLLGDAGNDILSGGIGNDTLTGGDGDDQLYGDAGVDSFLGGAGSDVLYMDSADFSAAFVKTAGTGTDYLVWQDTMAADLDPAALSAEYAYGFTGNDTFAVLFDAAEAGVRYELHGGDGNDELVVRTGEAVGSILLGEAGDDTLRGTTPGTDHYVGGAGADRFVMRPIGTLSGGTDYVYDFELGIDKLHFQFVPGITSIANLTINTSYAASGWYGYTYGVNGTVWVNTGGGALAAGDMLFS